MPELNRALYEALCDVNKQYLVEKNLIIDGNGSDIVLGEDASKIVKELKENERYRLEQHDAIYHNKKNKLQYSVLFLNTAIALIAGGMALASLFIASTIILPALPFLLISFAMVGLFQLFLGRKLNEHSADIIRMKSILGSLNEFDKTIQQESVSEKLFGVQNQIKVMHDKINNVEEKEAEVTQNVSQVLTKLGIFPTPPIPIPNADSANESLDEESVLRSAHS